MLPILLFLVLWLPGAVAQGQSEMLHIDSIFLEGNKKTKAWVLLRELEFKIGDSIREADLPDILDRNGKRLLNLDLFTVVQIKVKDRKPNNHISLIIAMTETWMMLPVPVFELSDRNFNVWWKEFNANINRVNYGVDLVHNNLSGYGDKLRLNLENGYNRRLELAYRLPPLNQRQTLTLQTLLAYSSQHEVAYQSIDNIVRFNKNPEIWNLTQYAGMLKLNWRPKLLTTHQFSLEYRKNLTTDSIGKILNPHFFLNGQTQQQHLSVAYTFVRDVRDIKPYPLHGSFTKIEFRHNGLTPNDNLFLSRISIDHFYYFPIFQPLYGEISAHARTSFPRKQPPYFNNQALGYGNIFVRGYQYYVSDGLDYALLKTSVHLQLLNLKLNLNRWMPFYAFKTFPLKAYLSANFDAGISIDPHYAMNNPLTNHWLTGYGLGLDIIAWYNKSARIEWSLNNREQSGIFLKLESGF
jgi:outer membrane protein assembly factor BamA